ncbi:hypothetical protein ACH43Y_05090 [Streptomyces rubiginosohelvolus]|uniref:hypothetical protein n=1 Tax=Streptomyces rubiginosohelvolus TaxID=67362 RepID=UPI0037A5760D
MNQPIRAQTLSVLTAGPATVLVPVGPMSIVYAPSTTYRPRARLPSPTPTRTGPSTRQNWAPEAYASTSAVPLTSAS